MHEVNYELQRIRELKDRFNYDIAQAVRLCGRAILLAHQDRIQEAAELLEEAERVWKSYRESLKEHPWMYGGLKNLEQELVEAKAYLLYRKEGRFLERDRLVFPDAYVLGMADLLGELRRLAVDLARRGSLDEALKVLGDMERLYLMLREIDYTAVKELRHKLDVYRRSIATLKEELVLMKYLERAKNDQRCLMWLAMSIFERKEGSIFAYGERVIFFRLKTRAALRSTILDLLGPEGGSLMLRLIGRRIGENSAKIAKSRRIIEDSQKSFEKLSEIYAQSGWGLWRFSMEDGKVIVRIKNSFEAAAHLEAIGKSDKPACFFIQGYLEGLLSTMLEKPVSVKETKCLAKGDEECEFVVSF